MFSTCTVTRSWLKLSVCYRLLTQCCAVLLIHVDLLLDIVCSAGHHPRDEGDEGLALCAKAVGLDTSTGTLPVRSVWPFVFSNTGFVHLNTGKRQKQKGRA